MSWFRKVWFFWSLFHFLWIMLLCLPFVILPIMIDEKKGGNVANIFLKIWVNGFGILSGIFFKAVGTEKLKKNATYIFTANHSSYLDSPAIVATIPHHFKALGKQEILKMPIFGFVFKHIGVTVDRSNNMSRIRSLMKIKEKIEKGIHILFFPEGTMNTTPNSLIPFQSGAFWLAIHSQTPIVPMAIKNSRQILPRNSLELRTGTIHVEFGEPIPTTGLTQKDLESLKEQTFERIREMLEKK